MSSFSSFNPPPIQPPHHHPSLPFLTRHRNTKSENAKTTMPTSGSTASNNYSSLLKIYKKRDLEYSTNKLRPRNYSIVKLMFTDLNVGLLKTSDQNYKIP